MDKEAVWSIFEKTGNINAYLLFNRLQNDVIMLSQEANKNADQNRRPGDKGNKRR